MTTRYSGNVKVNIVWLDSKDQYKADVSVGGKRGKTIYVGAPRVMIHGVDHPSSFDSAARAAISFAADEGLDVDGAEYDRSGVVVHRKKPSHAPKAPRGFTKAR